MKKQPFRIGLKTLQEYIAGGENMLDQRAIDLINKLLSEGKDVEIQIRSKNIIIFCEEKTREYIYRKN